jgi:hypothetical protein
MESQMSLQTDPDVYNDIYQLLTIERAAGHAEERWKLRRQIKMWRTIAIVLFVGWLAYLASLLH